MIKTRLRRDECDYEMVPKCPYCGVKYLDHEFSSLPADDGSSQMVECEDCGKPFEIHVWTTVRYESTPSEGWKGVEQPKKEEDECDIPW